MEFLKKLWNINYFKNIFYDNSTVVYVYVITFFKNHQ